MKFKFNLGDKLRNTITGFEGVVTSRTQWISNCNVYGLQSQKLSEGKPIDAQHFDEPTLELVVPNKHAEVKQKTGGPTRAPKQTNR